MTDRTLRPHLPLLGFGLWQVPDEAAGGLVATAIAAGYRLIDTAEAYYNDRARTWSCRAKFGTLIMALTRR